MYVATPLIALIQGSLLLNNYRIHYADAPRPVNPSNGVAIAVEEKQMSSTALSKALHGRAIYWTCIGTPGVTASQIVKDIHELEPYDPRPKARQLERLVKEFHIRRRRWIARQRQEEISGRDESESKQAQRLGTLNNKDDRRDDAESSPPKNYFVEWWQQVRQTDSFKSGKEIREATRRVTVEWWDQVRRTFQKRQEKVKEDIRVIKEIVLEPIPKLDDDDDDYYYDYYRDNPIEEDAEKKSDRNR
ncbi:MAG: hypothetical protein SGARI_007468, partial [Bacillariaceae sp.]